VRAASIEDLGMDAPAGVSTWVVTIFTRMHRVVETRLADINLKTDSSSTESPPIYECPNLGLCNGIGRTKDDGAIACGTCYRKCLK
jgi:hypothetical protein